jgi:hypothetical protein
MAHLENLLSSALGALDESGCLMDGQDAPRWEWQLSTTTNCVYQL